MSGKKRPYINDNEGVSNEAFEQALWKLEARSIQEPNLFVLTSSHLDTLCLIGHGKIRCADSCGQIAINGFTLSDTYVSFASPRWSSWATLTGLTPQSRIELQSVSSPYDPAGGPSFVIWNPRDLGSRPTTIPSTWKSVMDTVLQEIAAQQVACVKQATLQTSLDQAPAAAVCCRVAVTGAKGVGKSTFVRLLINQCFSLHPKVALMDLDLGQPELSPPGFISLTVLDQPLLQPPSTRTCREHHSAYFFGDITSQVDPHRYVECVQQALHDFVALTESTNPLPLFINCDGFVKGLGEPLLQTLLQTLEPTFVIQILGNLRSQQFEIEQVGHTVKILPVETALRKQSLQPEVIKQEVDVRQLHEDAVATQVVLDTGDVKDEALAHCDRTEEVEKSLLPHIRSPVPLSIAASVFRSQRIISYFINDDELWESVGISQDGIDDAACEIGCRLSAQQPYRISLQAIGVEFVNAELGRDLRSGESILDLMNGSIVGLCRRSDTHGKASGSETSRDVCPTHLLPCSGLGLVRSIDREKQELYILTPLPFHMLNCVNVLVIGHILPPLECYFRGTMTNSFIYLRTNWQADVLGSEPMQSRNSIARKSLIRK